MNIESWFPTIISYTDGNLLEELPKYASYCDEITSQIPLGRPFIGSQLVSTFNQAMPQYNYDISTDPRFSKLMELAVGQGEKFAEFLGFRYKLKVSHSWINRIGPHDYHEFHSHISSGDTLIVGCFYVAAPQGSKIKFKSPTANDYTPIGPTADTPYNSKIVSYDCVPGRIILFKSNTLHGYDSHNVNGELKFSIPFNLSVVK